MHAHTSPPPPAPTLTALAARFQRGDRDAFSLLYARLRPGLVHAATGIVRDPSEAEDVVQWTFLQAWQRRASLRDPARLSAWLRRIATHRALRRIGRRSRLQDLDAHLDALVTQRSAFDDVSHAEHRRLLRRSLTGLSPRQHDVVKLRTQRGLSFKEIGQRLGCSHVSARVNFTYGVRNLKAQLAA